MNYTQIGEKMGREQEKQTLFQEWVKSWIIGSASKAIRFRTNRQYLKMFWLKITGAQHYSHTRIKTFRILENFCLH